MDIGPTHKPRSRSMDPQDDSSLAGNIPDMLENTKACALEEARQRLSTVAQSTANPAQAQSYFDRLALQFQQGPGRHLEETHIDDAAALQIKEELEQAFLISSPDSSTISDFDPNPHAALVLTKKRNATNEDVSDESTEETPVAVQKAQRPFAPPKKLKDKNSLAKSVEHVSSRMTKNPSEWYQQIDMKQRYSRSDLQTLKTCITVIRKCEVDAVAGENMDACFSKLRRRLHQMEFYDFVSGVLIKQSKVLEDYGLPAIFDDRAIVTYPWDVVDDSIALYQRWMAGVLDPHLLRGIDSKKIQTSSGKYTRSHSLQKDYSGRVSCNYVGQGKLKNGQWFPMQICAMRDGAHGEIEAGIHGQPGKGAYSIVLSGSGYSDIDEGDTLKYCGTSGSDGKPTAGTRYLLECKDLSQPVRVLRSSNLPSKNIYRPAKGYRYDGLYDIIETEILDADTAMHRFLLKRCQRQNPIRYQGKEKRPTEEEQAEYEKIQSLLKSV